MATSGTPDASGQVNMGEITFADLFWRTMHRMKLSVPEPNAHTNTLERMRDYCFSFELTTPWNRVVVPHKEEKLTLIGVRPPGQCWR